MWPFKRKTTDDAPSFMFSQVDTTSRFGDNQHLSEDEWISTEPLNRGIADPESMGLPPLHASDDEVWRVASSLSEVRESVSIPDDGVYCPICHIATIGLTKLRQPCPKCERPLLKFGWD